MLEQTADPGVVERHGRRSDAKLGHEILVGKVRLGKGEHGGMAQRSHDRRDLLEHRVDVLARGGQQVLHFLQRHVHRPDLLHDQLNLAVVHLCVAGDPHVAARDDVREARLVEGPLPRRHLAGRVAKQALEVGLSAAGGADLRIEKAVRPIQVTVGRKIDDVDVLGLGSGH